MTRGALAGVRGRARAGLRAHRSLTGCVFFFCFFLRCVFTSFVFVLFGCFLFFCLFFCLFGYCIFYVFFS